MAESVLVKLLELKKKTNNLYAQMKHRAITTGKSKRYRTMNSGFYKTVCFIVLEFCKQFK